MPVIKAQDLTDYSTRIFLAQGVPKYVARTVSESLVLANLKGHDSHGVIRIIGYSEWLPKGWFNPDGKLEVVRDQGVILIVDGNFQFGQVIGREATELAIKKAQKEGVCILTIRRSGHLGRMGEWMEMAAEAGLVSFSFTNTHGGGVLVAPYGGRERRLSANPLAAGAPLPGGGAMIMDIATSATAEGKLKVARAKGEHIPEGLMVNARGEPCTDPEEFYAEPQGALLAFGGHKGYVLSVFADIFGGALSGGSCSKPGDLPVANGWFAIFVQPEAFCGQEFYDKEITGLIEWIKSSKLMKGFSEVMLPGEPEARAYEERTREGISVDEATWESIAAIARANGVEIPVTS